MPDITVDIQHPVIIDDVIEDVYGFIVSTSSGTSPSGQAYVAFMVEQLDQVGEQHVKSAARSLSRFVQEPDLEAEYRDAIEAKVLEAVAGRRG